MSEMKFNSGGMSKANKRYLDKALTVSALSDCKFKHGAVIVKSGRTIAVGINYDVNDPFFLDDEVAVEHAAVHAEVAALNACKKTDLKGAVIYVARRNRKGDPMMSRPCERCQKAIKARGIKKVFYTIDSEMDLS